MSAVKEAKFERIYDASAQAVWEAWTNPEKPLMGRLPIKGGSFLLQLPDREISH